MKLKKTTICAIPKCYAVLGLMSGNEPWLVYAGEASGSIQAFHGPDMNLRVPICEGGGGTMSLVPIADKEGWFFASRGFYSMVDCKDSEIDIIRYQDGQFHLEKVADIPYLHRFGLVTGKDGTSYLVAASLHGFKADKQDWSHPGRVYYAALPDDLERPFSLDFVQLEGEYHINHGFCTGKRDGISMAFTAASEGVFGWIPPAKKGEEWKRLHLINEPISDIAVTDLDGDGCAEIAALLPFHGDQCCVYREINGKYQQIYRHPVHNDFYHTVISATLGGQPYFVIGARAGEGELFFLCMDDGQVVPQSVERKIGACNADVFKTDAATYLLVASRYEKQENAVFYKIEL